MKKRSRFMFGRAQVDADERIVDQPSQYEALIELGNSMGTQITPSPANTHIPAAYTYLGQFINHDIARLAFMNAGDSHVLLDSPTEQITNLKDESLGLSCLYDLPALGTGELLVLGRTAPIGSRIRGKDEYHDLPRKGGGGVVGRSAVIGDPRNDDNLILSQLHVAFLRAHNALVQSGDTGASAKKKLCDIYSRIVVSDYLPRVLHIGVWRDILSNGPKYLDRPAEGECYIPLEFSLAAFRFGHSMIRSSYRVNAEFPNTSLRLIMQASGGRGDLFGFDRLIRNWVIDWSGFLPVVGGSAENLASCIDTNVFDPLSAFLLSAGSHAADGISLAARDLLKGYSAGLVTGQVAAASVGAPVLEGEDLLALVPVHQAVVLRRFGFQFKTPLWFYILAEAAGPEGDGGKHLGPLGSRIVGETLFRVLQQDAEEASVQALALRPAQLSTVVTLSEAAA